MSPLQLLGTLGCVALLACGGTSTSALGSKDGSAPGDGGAGLEAGPADGQADGGGGPSGDTAASDVASAYCARAQACAPAYVTVGFGDLSTCQARLKLEVLASFGAPGSSETPAGAEACARAIPQVSCPDLLSRHTPAACQTLPGALAAGAACGADSQCVGTRCRIAPGSTCGTCTTPAPAGAACGADSDCQPGMTCLNQTCTSYGDPGAGCSATQPCRPDLGCMSGQCGAPLQLGATCDASNQCDQLHGVFCNPVSKKCEAVGFAQGTAACGLVGGQLVTCAGPGALCNGSSTPPNYLGQCVPFAADGASCDADGGPLCDVGAVCSGGKCVLPDPSSCK